MICILKVVRYLWLMFSKTGKLCLKIYHFDRAKFHSAPGLAWQAAFKKTELKLELLTDWYDINS